MQVKVTVEVTDTSWNRPLQRDDTWNATKVVTLDVADLPSAQTIESLAGSLYFSALGDLKRKDA